MGTAEVLRGRGRRAGRGQVRGAARPPVLRALPTGRHAPAATVEKRKHSNGSLADELGVQVGRRGHHQQGFDRLVQVRLALQEPANWLKDESGWLVASRAARSAGAPGCAAGCSAAAGTGPAPVHPARQLAPQRQPRPNTRQPPARKKALAALTCRAGRRTSCGPPGWRCTAGKVEGRWCNAAPGAAAAPGNNMHACGIATPRPQFFQHPPSTHLALQGQREALEAARVQHLHPRIARRLLCLPQQLGGIHGPRRLPRRRRRLLLLVIRASGRPLLLAVQVVAAGGEGIERD